MFKICACTNQGCIFFYPILFNSPSLSVHLIPPPGPRGCYFLPHWRFIRHVFAFYACVCIRILKFFHCICFIQCKIHYFALFSCFLQQNCCSIGKNLYFYCCLNDFSLIFFTFSSLFFFFSLSFFLPALNFLPLALHFLPHQSYLAFNSPPRRGGGI